MPTLWNPVPETPWVPVPAERHARAWLGLVAVFALHVVDEATTGFLEFYNPLVLRIRADAPWFPMPTFTYDAWLAGLAVLLLLLALLTPAVRGGAPGTRTGSWVFGAIMFVNGIGHLAGSAYFGWWLPGATTAPLLLVASVALAWATSQRPDPRAT